MFAAKEMSQWLEKNVAQSTGSWFVGCIGVQHHFNSEGHIMEVGDAHVFPGYLTPVLTQLFFPKPPTTFLTCFCRGERRKYAGKESHLNQRSNSQPPGHD